MEANKIIITGGANRIGAAIAKKLSRSGVEMVIHYNKSKSNAENLKKIEKFCKIKIKYFDCLVNNASLFENDKLENFTTDSWGKHLRTNLRATALLSK